MFHRLHFVHSSSKDHLCATILLFRSICERTCLCVCRCARWSFASLAAKRFRRHTDRAAARHKRRQRQTTTTSMATATLPGDKNIIFAHGNWLIFSVSIRMKCASPFANLYFSPSVSSFTSYRRRTECHLFSFVSNATFFDFALIHVAQPCCVQCSIFSIFVGSSAPLSVEVLLILFQFQR